MNTILVIDIETTGFQSDGGSIVEVGIVSLNLGTGDRETVFDSVCREDILTAKHREPPMGWIFKNSSLTVEEVRSAKRLPDLLPEIQTIIDNHPLGATAYNRVFDFNFLESRGVRFKRALDCPMKLATPLLKLPPTRPGTTYKWPKVEEAWKFFSRMSHTSRNIVVQTTPTMRPGSFGSCISAEFFECNSQTLPTAN